MLRAMHVAAKQAHASGLLHTYRLVCHHFSCKLHGPWWQDSELLQLVAYLDCRAQAA
jgi:hypothetical protein